MTDREIDLLDHELLLRGINMDIPASVFHMDLDKALSVCLDLHAGYNFSDAIIAYEWRNL